MLYGLDERDERTRQQFFKALKAAMGLRGVRVHSGSKAAVYWRHKTIGRGTLALERYVAPDRWYIRGNHATLPTGQHPDGEQFDWGPLNDASLAEALPRVLATLLRSNSCPQPLTTTPAIK
jgi:hypothetical protein